MSEYQYLTFRAIDRPVSDKNLKYMRRQSTRAEMTRWSFTNEYHYGDFRGNAREMLRRGYDIHLHYAHFGIRTLLIRLPNGLPDHKAAKTYFDADSFHFVKDEQGSGGVLELQPFYEPGDLDELWDLEEMLTRLVPLRNEILSGDLRPLFVAHLAVRCDSDHDPAMATVAPVPAGLGQPTDAQIALADFYEISRPLLAAAARDAPPPPQVEPRAQFAEWLAGRPERTKDAWLAELLEDANSPVRADILTESRKERSPQAWPTVPVKRTIADLQAAAAEIQAEWDSKAAAKAARTRARKLAKMAADPASTLRKTEQLVAQRSMDAYDEAGNLLADLRDALRDSEQSDLAEAHARKFKQKYPRRSHLTAALRRHGLLPK